MADVPLGRNNNLAFGSMVCFSERQNKTEKEKLLSEKSSEVTSG
jgi:hypothetical protein